ncbi:MAG: tRNA epoxyqueuosine(34) reductase QueG [Bacteroidales bacterium]|nr:tRNA epoxyqueuosine(34) reductase QueG [Bacteroidales bacterium]
MIKADNLPENLIALIKDEAIRLGFDDLGISKAQQLPEDACLMEDWLQKGFQGDMSYLERNREKRYDPRLLVEGTATVLTVLQNYYPKEKLSENDNYKISKYAYGKDYHKLIRKKLQQLLQFIENHTGKLEGARVFTDSAPVLDRAWAQKSGLGFIGKNTCLIHPQKGSFFFIGHLLIPIGLRATENEITDYCGTCRRCIDACPTGALVDAHQLDARKCISYLTIEHKAELPDALKLHFEGWIFGCDICQDVCPWNRFSKPHHEPGFLLSEQLKKMRKDDWENLNQNTFNELFAGSAVKRTGFSGLKRNITFIKTS